MLMLAKQELHSVQYAKIKSAAVSVKNEVMEMIVKVRERKSRIDLLIVSGKQLRRISVRTALQPADNAEKFITTRKIDSFEVMTKRRNISSWKRSLKGLSKMRYDKEHTDNISKYPELKERMLNLLHNSVKTHGARR